MCLPKHEVLNLGCNLKGMNFEKLPGVVLLQNYKRSWLTSDLIAALVLSMLLVPQGMAYAELAGLPIITGLYTTVLCLVAYAVFGPSKILVLGPDSALGPMIAVILVAVLGASATSSEMVGMASTLALFVGLIMIAASVLKLGFVADLLSKPTQIGYMNGLALTILVGQLPKLFGFSTDADGLISEVQAFIHAVISGETVGIALGVGLLSLVLMFTISRFLPKVPGILVAVLAAMFFSSVFALSTKGVSVVGVLPQGLPPFTIPVLPSLSQIPILLGGAMAISLLALTDTISVASSFAARAKREVNSNGEIMGIGMANFASSFFQGFPACASGSRTVVAEQAGAKTQITGIFGAVIILVMLLLLPWLFQNLPQPTLAAVVIAASVSLADIPATKRLWSQRRSDFYISIIAFLGVAFLGVLAGILIAIIISILMVFKRIWSPYHTTLLHVDGVRGYHDKRIHPSGNFLPGLIIFRFDAPIFFANARTFREEITRLAAKRPKPKWIVISGEPITDIDTTAADMLFELKDKLSDQGTYLIFAGLKNPVKTKLRRYGLLEALDPEHFYPTLKSAVEDFRKNEGVEWKARKAK